MTSREAMQALLDGKRLLRKDMFRSKDKFVHLVDDQLVWASGHPATLIDGEFYEIYEEPNPHPKGTFNWAREEARRGKAVTRRDWTNAVSCLAFNFRPSATWSIESYEATDWEVVT